MALILVPNLQLNALTTEPPFPFNHTRIGYESIVTSSNITASSADAGFPASSLANPLTYEQWRPTTSPATVTIDGGSPAPTCDYVGLAAHNLATVNATVTVAYSYDDVTYTTLSEFSPGDNSPVMLISQTQILARYWKVTIEWPSGTPQIGVLYIGEALAMQRPMYGGHSPITMSRVTETYGTRSDSGQWLGLSIIRKGVETDFSWRHLTAQWYREYFEPFVKAARTTPFFISWRPSEYTGECGYCKTKGDIRPSNMGVRDFMEVSMSVMGITDD